MSTLAGRSDAWPRTRRTGPWLVALLLAVVCLTPFDAVSFNLPLPVDAKLDRVVLGMLIAFWALRGILGPPFSGRRHRMGAPEALLVLFAMFCLSSIASNYHVLDLAGDAEGAIKQLAVIVALLAFYAFAVGNVRSDEIEAFITLLIVLTAGAALGTIFEYSTHINVFYDAASSLLGSVARITPHTFVRALSTRPDVSGPTRHGLAVATMLAIALPFAVVRSIDKSRPRAARLIFAGLTLVLFTGAFFTLRRSGVILPLCAAVFIVVFGGRPKLAVLAMLGVVVTVVSIAFPGVTKSTIDQLRGRSTAIKSSTEGRTSDYAAVAPDFEHRALTGRGFSVYNGAKYRILDNEYLGLAVETGVPGVVAFLLLILSVLVRSIRLLARGSPRAQDTALACGAAVTVFLVAGVLFDELAFPQAPYLFLFVAALVNTLVSESRPPVPPVRPHGPVVAAPTV